MKLLIYNDVIVRNTLVLRSGKCLCHMSLPSRQNHQKGGRIHYSAAAVYCPKHQLIRKLVSRHEKQSTDGSMNIFSEVNRNMKWEASEKLAETNISSEKCFSCGTNKLILPCIHTQSVSELDMRISDSHLCTIS